MIFYAPVIFAYNIGINIFKISVDNQMCLNALIDEYFYGKSNPNNRYFYKF